jgi:hypothetical protein
MAERWQQWMPFHIDRFRGSPDVQAMHPVARMGYLYLLASAWQTDDCTISDDPLDLASMSGLGDELWAQYCPRILRKFEAAGTAGRLYNPVLREEWSEAKRIFEARSAAARKTTETRSPSKKRTVTVDKANGHRTVSARRPVRSADTITGTTTGTDTSTKPQKQKPSRAKKRREVQAKRPCKTDMADVRHKEFKAAIGLYWNSKNPTVEMPWGPPEGKALGIWLRASPTTTVEQFTGYLRNRFKSDANHTDRPSKWIHNITSYATEPLNKFNQPQSLNGGNAHVKPERSAQILTGAQRLDEKLRSQAVGQPALSGGGVDET